MQQRLYCTGIIYQLKQDRMCNCITAHARLYDYLLVRASPRHPRHRAKGRHFRIDAYCGGFCRNPVMSSTNTTTTAANTAVTAMAATTPQNNAQLSRL